MSSSLAFFLDIIGVLILVVGMYLFMSYVKLTQFMRRLRSDATRLTTKFDRRYALLTDLLACIRENGVEEKAAVSAVVKARAQASRAKNTLDHIGLETNFTISLLRLLVILRKKYPELNEDMWYVDIMAKFKALNKSINDDGRAYNVMTRSYNDLVKAFPSKIVAKWLKYKPEPVYFSFEEARLKLSGKEPIPEKELRKQEYAVQNELNKKERAARKAQRAEWKKGNQNEKEKKKKAKEHEKEVYEIMKQREADLQKEEQARMAEREAQKKEKDLARRKKYEDEKSK